jgi:hypothetical protein
MTPTTSTAIVQQATAHTEYPPTTDPDRILDAIDRLRDLRSQAMNHYDTLNNWLIIDTLTDAITLLQATGADDAPEVVEGPPCGCQQKRHNCDQFNNLPVTVRES